MCTGVEVAALVSAAAATAGTAYSMTQGKQSVKQPQASTSPTTDAYKKKNAATYSTGAALDTSTASQGTSNLGTSTLLGQ